MIVVPSKMGRINKRALLTRLQRLGIASRAELAKSLGMSQPTAGKIADELLELGVLEEVTDRLGASTNEKPGPARLGRPGRMLRLNRSKPRFLVIELGVSGTRLACMPVGVHADDRWDVEFPTPSNSQEWQAELAKARDRIRQRNFWGVLVSVPGIVDETANKILFSPNLHWTETLDICQVIQQVWNGVPAAMVQEERALALGHQYVEPECDDFLLVDFGDGVGGAMVLGGKLYTSPLPLNGEFGHTPVLGNKRECGCGARGCVETLVSTRGLTQSYAQSQGRSSATWAELTQHVARKGVEPWLAETLETAAVSIAGALNILGLRRVVVTGSLTELQGGVMSHFSQAVTKGVMWARFGSVTVTSAPRRRAAGLVAVGMDRMVLPMTEHADAVDSEGAPMHSFTKI